MPTANTPPFRLNRARTQRNDPVLPSVSQSNGGSPKVVLSSTRASNGGSTNSGLPHARVSNGGSYSDSLTSARAPGEAAPNGSPPAYWPPDGTGRLRVLEHPIADHILAALRDRDTPPEQFRLHCQRLLLFLLVEATRSLPRGEFKGEAVRDGTSKRTGKKVVVFLSLNRHGLGLTHQMADCIPDAVTGVISVDEADRGRPEARLHLVRAPALSEARVMVFAPVVATGLSTCLALKLLRRSGATDITLISLITSEVGQMRIQASDPGIEMWTAAVDHDWDSRLGPVPGIGNFVERLYGPKNR